MAEKDPTNGGAPITPAPPSSVRDALAAAPASNAAPAPVSPAPIADSADDPSVRDALATEPKKEVPTWAAGIPEHMIGETVEETLDNVNKAYTGSRQELSKKGAPDVPETADGYAFELPEDYTKQFGDGKDDPLLTAFRERAHKLGVGQEAAQELAAGFVTDAMANEFFEAPMSIKDFYADLGGDEIGGKLVGDVGGWVRSLAATGRLGDASTPDGKAAVDAMMNAGLDMAALSPDAVRFLDTVRRSTGGTSMALPQSGDVGFEPTRDNLRKAMADPRYNPGAKFDASFRAKIDGLYDALDKAS
jgi:hypothetical protein